MIYILVGIPASGKTTRTKSLEARSKRNGRKCVVISRDLLRAELAPHKEGKFIGNLHFEERVTELFNKRLCKALSQDCDIILDNMNIRPRYVKENLSYIKHFNKTAVIEFAEFTDDLNKCIELNRNRPKNEQVPEKAIRGCYETYKSTSKELLRMKVALENDDKKFWEEIKTPSYIPNFCPFDIEPDDTPEDLPQAYIFDVDGTLAAHNRSPYDYEKCMTDSVIYPTARIARILSEDATIIIMSGRPEIDNSGNDIRGETEQWLKKNNIHYAHLFMRKEGDKRNDAIVKYELFNENVRGKYKVIGVFDDRLRVLSMWEELGVPVFNVNNGMGEY